MSSFISGNVRKIIYESNTSSYKVGIFKIRETDNDLLDEYVNHTIYFVGNFGNINTELKYKLYGQVINHPKYGIQFNVDDYETINPTSTDEIISYLGSGLFDGIGLKTAKKIVNKFKEETLIIIKNHYEEIPPIINLTKAKKLSDKLNNLSIDEELIRNLTVMGFSVNESIKIVKNYKLNLRDILHSNLYILTNLIDFDKVDSIYVKYNDVNSDLRIKQIIMHSIKEICYKTGNTLVSRESTYLSVMKYFNNSFQIDSFNLYVENLIKESMIYEIDNYLTLSYFYETEKKISDLIHIFNKVKTSINTNKLDKYISNFEESNKIKLNDEQINAIKGSLINNLFVLTGGPGTGKTTIIKAIVDYYENKNDITLLAPTGRSAKRMSESVLLPASTIHKFLKWNKEDGTFGLNINNKSKTKIVIIDEFSMVDMFLFSSLIDALKDNVKLVIVGDANQLPSIGPGNLLFDILSSDNIHKEYLTKIYRTGNNSYINILADKVKNKENCEFIEQYDDFKFIESEDSVISKHIYNISNMAKEKKLKLDEFQILIPMYKGINGIDSINKILQSIFNPYNDMIHEIDYGSVTYRENDKVMNLINDVENNIYNGDIGYITKITTVPKKTMEINYSGNVVIYETENFDKITHAYAISIHKSQGSEYENVIVVLSSNHKRMFYNKLIYTGITRAKKSLIMIGKLSNFNYSISSKEEIKRKTYLSNLL